MTRFDISLSLFQENTGKGYVVGKVVAADTDSGQAGDISYTFKSSTDTFNIDGDTGQIDRQIY